MNIPENVESVILLENDSDLSEHLSKEDTKFHFPSFFAGFISGAAFVAFCIAVLSAVFHQVTTMFHQKILETAYFTRASCFARQHICVFEQVAKSQPSNLIQTSDFDNPLNCSHFHSHPKPSKSSFNGEQKLSLITSITSTVAFAPSRNPTPKPTFITSKDPVPETTFTISKRPTPKTTFATSKHPSPETTFSPSKNPTHKDTSAPSKIPTSRSEASDQIITLQNNDSYLEIYYDVEEF